MVFLKHSLLPEIRRAPLNLSTSQPINPQPTDPQPLNLSSLRSPSFARQAPLDPSTYQLLTDVLIFIYVTQYAILSKIA
jgi:hypothetical protein